MNIFILQEVHLHPKWRQEGNSILYYDVAIIKLEKSLNFTKDPYIQPICLPSEPSLPESKVSHSVTTQGYGKDKHGNTVSELSQIDVTIR